MNFSVNDNVTPLSVLLLNRQQLKAEPSLNVLQRSDGTETEVLKQNHVLLLQQNTKFTLLGSNQRNTAAEGSKLVLYLV